MKNLLKIWALSLALIATVFVLNTKAADSGTLTLEIQKGTGSCQYATSLDLWIKPASYAAITFSGDFTSAFRCEDNNGTSSGWTLTMAASTLTNASNSSYTIPNTSIKMKNSQPAIALGTCHINSGTLSLTALDSVQPILGKLNDLGAICKVQSDVVSLEVVTAANQAVGIYTGTLTIDVPNFN